MNEKHLFNLELTPSASLEDIKASYRKLAKVYHPDINKSGAEKFKSITDSYNWLMKNHKPKPALRNADGYDHYYEILDRKTKFIKVGLWSRSEELDSGAVIYFMRGTQEFRLFVEKGTELPKIIEVTNIGDSLKVHLYQKKLEV